jgi:protein-S-isoprenylcysteine O-methyltransferase Ste14
MDSGMKWYIQAVIKAVISIPIFVIILMVLAGRTDYWQGWIFCGIICIGAVVQFIMFRDSADLAQERMKPGAGTKWWDKIIFTLFGLLFFGEFILAVLDAGRFRWTDGLHWTAYVAGYAVHIGSYIMTIWPMRVNRFFSSTVRIQHDRGQTVVTSGPYGYVRHPGYVGGILLALSSPVVLGSLVALVPAFGVVMLLILRTYLEDRMLQNELEGYTAYAARVRFRLFPGIW